MPKYVLLWPEWWKLPMISGATGIQAGVKDVRFTAFGWRFKIVI